MFENPTEMTSTMAAVASVDLTLLDADGLLEHLSQIQQLESGLAARKAETMVAFHQVLSGTSADLGHEAPRPGDRAAGPSERRWSADVLRSVADEIALTLGAHRKTAARWLNWAAVLVDRFPTTLTLLRTGAITITAAQHIARELAVIVDDDLRAAVEQVVLAWGRRYGWRRIKKTAQREAHKVLAEYESLLHAQRQDERTTYTKSHDGGMADLIVSTTAIDITAIMAALTLRARELQREGDPRDLNQLRTDLAVNRLLGNNQTTAPNPASTTSSEHSPDTEPHRHPDTAPDVEPGWSGDPVSGAVPGWSGDPASDVEPGWSGDPVSGAVPGWSGDPASDVEPGWSGDPASDVEPGWSGDPASGAEPGWSGDPASDGESGQCADLGSDAEADWYAGPASDGEPDRYADPTSDMEPHWYADPPDREPERYADSASGVEPDWYAGHVSYGGSTSDADAARSWDADSAATASTPTVAVAGESLKAAFRNASTGAGADSDSGSAATVDAAASPQSVPPESGLNPAVAVQVVIHCTYAEAEALATGAICTGGELEGYGPLPQDALAMAFRRAQFRYRLTDRSPKSDPDRYTPSPGLDQHVRDRDQHCRFPGCTAKVQSCDLDHRVPFPEGSTEEDNLEPLCRHHHRLKHHGDWQVFRTDTGTLVFISPTGRAYLEPPTMPDTGHGTPDIASRPDTDTPGIATRFDAA